MRLQKLLIAAILCITLAGLSGCNKTWSFDFTATTDISDWNLDADTGTIRSLDSDGLVLDGLAMSTPMSFTGNVTATIEFDLSVDASDTLYMQFAFTDHPLWVPNNYINVWMDNVGNIGSEQYMIEDFNEGTGSDIVASLSGGNISLYLVRKGSNAWVMEKTGSRCEFYINGEYFDGFDIEHFNSEDCYIRFSSGLSKGGMVYFKNISVVYSGETLF